VTVTHAPRQSVPDYEIDSWANATQQTFLGEFHRKYPASHPGPKPDLAEESYAAPPDYSDTFDHFSTFFEAVRTRAPVVEDPVFGFRAAGPALLSNVSYFEQRVCMWDPQSMTLKS
jgi:hypothetical protein